MSFTRAQQGLYRPLVKKAWERHCKDHSLDPKDKQAHEDWYKQTLWQVVRKSSTASCNKGRDFEALMAHFETVARDDIHWQMEAYGGAARRILHSLQAWRGKHNRTEEYLRKIAKQMLKLDHLPQLADLDEDQLTVIQRAVMIDNRRRKHRGEDPAKARPSTRPYHRKTSPEPPRFPAADISTTSSEDIPY